MSFKTLDEGGFTGAAAARYPNEEMFRYHWAKVMPFQ